MQTKNNYITSSVLVFSAFIALITNMGSDIDAIKPFLFSLYIDNSPEIRQGQLWRLITPTFLHFGLPHLAFNGSMIWIFGSHIERTHSKLTYLCLIISSAILCNLSQYIVSDTIFGGLSGVVFAFIGFLWLLPKINSNYPIYINNSMAIFFVASLAIGFSGILELFNIHIANTAHVIGLVTGLAFSAFIATRHQ